MKQKMLQNILQMLQDCMNFFMLQPLITILPFLILLFFFYKHIFRKHSTKKHLPPSPNKLPIIGNLHQIDHLPHRSLHRLSQQHGELMLLQLGTKPVIVVSSAEVACEIMKTHDTIFADRPQLTIFKRLLFDCKDICLAPYGDYWKHMRSICVLHLLSSKRVQSFGYVRNEQVAEMIRDIEGSLSKPVNLSRMFVNFSSGVICRVAFGMKCNGERDGINFKELTEKHEELIGGFFVGEFIPWLSWINYVNGVENRIKKVARDMDRFLEGIIQEHRERRLGRNDEEGGGGGGGDDGYGDGCRHKDLVDVLLELQHDDDTGSFSLGQDSIKAIILDMFVAGTTSTYATLDWAMSELLRKPETMEALYKDVRGITGSKQSITEDDLEKMQYLKAVIKESLRLHPPTPLLLPRYSAQEAKINGYDIPAKTQVMINAWAIQRDKAAWDKPEEFIPERFLNSPIDFKGQYFNLIPFGSGRRGCPGILFANMNIELLLANLINKFNWELPDGAEGKNLDMSENPGITTHRKVPLVAIPTTSAS